MALHDLSSSPSGVAVIYDSLLTGAAASFDVQNIPGGYRALKMTGQIRSSQAIVDATALLRFNNDSGANYDNHNFFGALTSGSASQSATFADTQIAFAVNITGDSAPANRATNIEIEIPNYDGTTFNKQCSLRIGAPNVTTGTGYWQADVVGNWRSTAAITRVQLVCGASANFMAGSRFTIFGL